MPKDGRTPSVGCMVVGLGALAVVVGGVFALDAITGPSDDPTPPTTSSSVDTAVETTVVTTAASTAPPSSVAVEDAAEVDVAVGQYTVVYRVELMSGGTVLVDTEVRRHRFPFETEVLVFPGEPDDLVAAQDEGQPTERSVHVMGGFETGPPNQVPSLLTTVPGPAAQVGHFGGDIDRAVAERLMQPTGVRLTVADRECDVYRTRSPLDVGLLEHATADDATELCISTNGLVLREVWSVDGELFRRRTAVSVSESAVSPDRFVPRGHRIPDASGGGRVRRLTPDSTVPGVPHLLPSTLPEGFASIGRFVYVADSFETETGNVQVDRVVSLVDVYLTDRDVLVVENGGDIDGRVPVPPGGIEVEVSGSEDAVAFLTSRHSQVFVPVDGRFVRITSTLPLDDVVALASSLTDHPGTGEVTPMSDELDITGRIAPEDLETHEHEREGDARADEHTHDGSTHSHD